MAIAVNDIISRVKTTFGDEAGVQVTDAKIYNWLTDAVREAGAQDANLLQSIASGTVSSSSNKIAWPTDLLTFQALYIEDKKVPYFTVQQLDQAGINWYNQDQIRGTPIAWTRMGADIYVFPLPDKTLNYRILYSKNPVAITSSSSPIDLPDYYFNYLVDFCLMRAYEMDEDWEAVAAKAGIVQSTLDGNSMRNNHFGKDYFPTVTEVD